MTIYSYKKKINYDGYFKNNQGREFSLKELSKQENYMYGQFKFISKFCPFNKNDRILEIGAGLGSFIGLLKKEGYANLYATEMDVDAADFIIKTQNIKVITTPLEEFPFNGMKFNKIVALEVLEHLTNPSLGLSVLFDLLEPNGVLIVTTPPPYHKNLLDSTHLYVLPAKCWERLFEYAGYLNIRIIPLSLIPFLYRISKYLSLGYRISTGMPGIVSTNLIIAQK